MKVPTTGLKVRFFRVATATGHGRGGVGSSTGRILTGKRSALGPSAERGKIVRYGPDASRLTRRWIEKVDKVTLGGASPRSL